MVLADDPAEVIAINVLGEPQPSLCCAGKRRRNLRLLLIGGSASAISTKTNRSTNNIPCARTTRYSASKAAMEMVLRGLWGKVPIDLCSLRFTVIYGPGRETTFTVEEIVRAALAGKSARIATDDRLASMSTSTMPRAAVEACFSKSRKQLQLFHCASGKSHARRHRSCGGGSRQASSPRDRRQQAESRAGSTRYRACCARFRVSRASRSSRR